MRPKDELPGALFTCYEGGVQRWLRRAVAWLVGGLCLWILLLFIGGYAGAGCAREKARERLAGSMKAAVTIGDLDLGLVTGAIAVSDVKIVKDETGYLRIEVDRVDLDVLPLGLALTSDSAGDVHVRGVDVEISALGALDLRGGKRPPMTFDSLVIDNAHVTVQAAHVLPGFAELDVTIERASAGATTLRTPLSWLFALRELRAYVDVPLGGKVHVHYAGGVVRLSGSMFGSTPVELPFELPVHEPARELEQLGELATRLLAELMKRAF